MSLASSGDRRVSSASACVFHTDCSPCHGGRLREGTSAELGVDVLDVRVQRPPGNAHLRGRLQRPIAQRKPAQSFSLTAGEPESTQRSHAQHAGAYFQDWTLPTVLAPARQHANENAASTPLDRERLGGRARSLVL